MNVSLRHLRVFAEICRYASYSRAAQALGLSPSALTLTIHQLEAELGVPLLDRSTRHVSPTGAGREFLPQAQRLIRDFDASLRDMQALARREVGHVSVATAPSLMSLVMPDAVQRYAAQYPDIRISLREDNSLGVQERVRNGDMDFGLTIQAQPDAALTFEPLFSNPFGVVFAPDHPLGDTAGPLRWEDLLPYRLVGYTLDTGMQTLLDAAPGLPQQVREPFYRVSSTPVIVSLVGRGLGVAVIPSLAALPEPLRQLSFRLLEQPLLTRDISLVRRAGQGLSPAAQAMLEIVCARIAQLADQRESLTTLAPARPKACGG